MARYRYCPGGTYDADLFRYDKDLDALVSHGNYFEIHDKRADFPAPAVVGDGVGAGVNGLRHMADGKYYDSKAKFREVTKDHGCVEVGNSYDHAQVHHGATRKTNIDRRAAQRARVEVIKETLDDHRSGRIARGERPGMGQPLGSNE